MSLESTGKNGRHWTDVSKLTPRAVLPAPTQKLTVMLGAFDSSTWEAEEEGSLVQSQHGLVSPKDTINSLV